jgi:molecular chaperone GrpE (heat shock protein)
MVKTFDPNEATTSEKDTIENEANQRNDSYDQKKIQELESDLDFAREEILNLKKIIMNLQQEKMKLQLEIVNYKNDYSNQ